MLAKLHRYTVIVWPSPGAATAISGLLSLATLVAGLLLLGTSATRLATSSEATRRIQLPVMVPAGLVGAMLAVHAAAVLLGPIEEPQSPMYAGMFVVLAWSVAA